MNPDMTSTLESLEYIPYLNEVGETTEQFSGKVGVYAIFDHAKTLQFIGYSRDVSLSLKQHLVRQPEQCYWLKVQTIDRPSRTILEEIRGAWITENGSTPVGNDTDEALWNQPIDAKLKMTAAEQAAYAATDEMGKIKTLKQVARRIEAEVLADLEARGVKMAIRFDPKLKEEGLLNLK
ncbi:MAG: GIY-YIG nuclease family protein [Leptolyngbyaceae cyanobacterium CSU_1_4]|nr:GIY-YIG nuclease family protein [Leptolyngbyaceae cyanobacterium CSU_1_4]